MKKTFKTIFTVFFAAVLLLSSSACSKDKTTASGGDSNKTPTNNSAQNDKEDGNDKDADKTEPETENVAFNGTEDFYKAIKTAPVDETELFSEGGYKYIARYYDDEGKKYTLLLRKNDVTEEKLWQFSDRWECVYAQNSYENSSKRNIYISLFHEYNYYDGYNSKLMMINCSTGGSVLLYERAVSQMIVPETASAGFEAVGWVLHENRIVPINLADGSELKARIFDLSKDYSAPEISGTFFYYPSGNYEVKISALELYDNETLKITVSEYVTDKSIEPSVVNYTFRYKDETLKRLQ